MAMQRFTISYLDAQGVAHRYPMVAVDIDAATEGFCHWLAQQDRLAFVVPPVLIQGA